MDYTSSTSLLSTDTLIANNEYTHAWLDKFDLRLSADKTTYGVFVLKTLNKSFDNFKDAQQLYIELCQETIGSCSINPQPTKKTKKATKLSEIKKEISKLLNYGHSDLLIWQTIQSDAFNHNDVVKEVLNRLQVKTGLDFSEMNWRKTETWQLVLEMIKEVQGEGVNESLGEVDGGSLQPTLINNSINDSAIWNYKIIQSSWHPDSYHMWMYEGEKSYYYFHTDNMVSEIKLQDLETKVSELNAKASTKSVTVQSCGTWNNIFTCNDMELAKLLASQYYQLNRDNIMQRSLAVAEIHSQAIKQQELLKYWQLEQNNIVTCFCCNNITEFKGMPVEHFNHASDAWLSAMGNNLDNSVLISTDSYEGIPLVNINNKTVVFTSSFLESLKLANEWLGVKQEQVPSTKERLTPKLELFTKFTEYTFLMGCYLDLITHFNIPDIKLDLQEASYNLYCSWCSLTAICFKRYVLMPTKHIDVHTKLLLIHLEATSGYVSTMAYYSRLDTKSIYA